MAKRKNSFSVKGELNIAEGIVYEEKKIGKGEVMIVEIPFFDFLKEFDGKNVSISISEDIEVEGVEVETEDEDEDY